MAWVYNVHGSSGPIYIKYGFLTQDSLSIFAVIQQTTERLGAKLAILAKGSSGVGRGAADPNEH